MADVEGLPSKYSGAYEETSGDTASEQMISPDFKVLTEGRKFTPVLSDVQKEWKGPFVFVQASNTQPPMMENNCDETDSAKWDREVHFWSKAVEKINTIEPKPLFLVICGDLVDAWPNGETRKYQEMDFKRTLGNLHSEIPLVCVCGIRDVGNVPTTDSIATYRSSFGDDFYSFWFGGCFFIVLNSQLMFDKTEVSEYASLQMEWLEVQLKGASSQKPKHMFVFQHIPWFVDHLEETDTYFNIPTDTRKSILEKLAFYGVKYIFCGQYSQNLSNMFGDMEVVVTTGGGTQMGDVNHGLRIVSVEQDKVTHKYYYLDEIPGELKLNEN